MSPTVSIPVVALLSYLLNVPLGAWRARCRKLSVAWFAAIHASVPILVAARLLLGIRWPWIPLFVLLAVLGQFTGGTLRRDRTAVRSSNRR